MEPKKNPKKDLNRSQGIYFVLGLLLALLMTFTALEWKTYDKQNIPDFSMNSPEMIEDEIPPITLNTPPPPPPPVAPAIIEIVPDEKDFEEAVIEATEPEEDKIIEVKDVVYEEVEEEVKVNWISIEEVPVFPGCENEKDKRACFQKMMNRHISKVFKYPEVAQEMGIQGKVFTQFTIQKDGTIGNILLRGPDKILEKEAERIIGTLPKMKPGKQRDRNVKVAFNIPITFKLQ